MTKVGEYLKKERKTKKCVFNWDNDAPKKFKDVESQIKETLEPDAITKVVFIGNGNIQGTYFHPDLAIHVMKWLVPNIYDSKAHELIYQSIIDENAP